MLKKHLGKMLDTGHVDEDYKVLHDPALSAVVHSSLFSVVLVCSMAEALTVPHCLKNVCHFYSKLVEKFSEYYFKERYNIFGGLLAWKKKSLFK